MNKSWYRARKTAAEELPGKHARIEATNAGETAASAVSSKETCGVLSKKTTWAAFKTLIYAFYYIDWFLGVHIPYIVWL